MHLLLKNTRNKDLLDGFKEAVIAYNKELEALIDDSRNGIAKNLDERHHLPFKLVRCLLRQVYDRVVSPRVDFLKKKTDNKDNTYGELHDNFVSAIIEQTSLKSTQVFVDLGSGVGNVVLQAALEAGCESWGCEMMETAGEVAKAQKREFRARCRLWGIQPGPVHLERGDFRENKAIMDAIKKADVILVNNEVFGPDLNESLKLMFLDVKDGCKVVCKRFIRVSLHEFLTCKRN
jgi:H3 lysine-79-specific histone-lysine N-methyltransferase